MNKMFDHYVNSFLIAIPEKLKDVFSATAFVKRPI
jgi:hypothetical protein